MNPADWTLLVDVATAAGLSAKGYPKPGQPCCVVEGLRTDYEAPAGRLRSEAEHKLLLALWESLTSPGSKPCRAYGGWPARDEDVVPVIHAANPDPQRRGYFCRLLSQRGERSYVYGTEIGTALVALARLRPERLPELDAAATVLLASSRAVVRPAPKKTRKETP